MSKGEVVLDAQRVLSKMAEFSRWIRLPVELCVFAASGTLAFLLRFDFRVPGNYLVHLGAGVCVWMVAKGLVFQLLRLDRGWRFLSLYDLTRLGAGNLAGSAAGAAGILLIAPAGFPRSIYVLDLLICFVFTGGLRVFARMMADALKPRVMPGERKRTLIYGAGDAGELLLREIRQNPALPYEVAGFVDDDGKKKGLSIQGTKVLGCGPDLARIATHRGVDLVLIAIASASGAQMTQVLRRCHEAGVSYKTNGLARQIRDVAVEDLLGRTPVRLEQSAISARLGGRVVLVTGAAGSIGSELCRQIARFGPAAIVGFEIAESPLFELDREMRQAFPETPFYPEIGSIQNRARVEEVVRQYSPSVIYHAAAYKHVPLMEAHIFEAVENNVFGTYNVAVVAAECGVEEFVLISSDKAVRPTNVMGATKRVAELLLLALQGDKEVSCGTEVPRGLKPTLRFVAVRFGNVLGSTGSVIPIFKKQIAAGGPVTVTHPEMRRFFMTIPEACQLVLQAAAIGEGGQICVLDMGEPVKIVDLARDLILLSGLRPDEDIKIEFTGMRPGEKLYEEVSTMLEDTAPSAHEKIRIFVGNGMPEGDVMTWLDYLREICAERDAGRLVVTLKEIVPDYSPSTHLLKRVIETRGRGAVAAAG
ncbi:MAG: nucleoside-diphosphate sugar epimerase/dehydratase [Acidobacteria bacterium]|nr:nucleoside-diphosphate sugar epimerase/dehydratase [Acidobacteriota bacterium]